LISDSALTGEVWPFVRVKIYDQNSGKFLGEADAGSNGQFTVIFALPAAPNPDIECRVYKVVDGDSELLPPAREGINSFTSLAPHDGVGLLKVVSDEIIAYGDEGFRTYDGVGIVFTRVGKVEIPYISQDTALSTAGNRAMAGLADFTLPVPSGVTDGIVRAGELGIHPFKKAPFGGRLLIFGDFGLPGGACTGDQIDFYQVEIRKVNETSPVISYDGPEILWKDPMSKTKTEVTVWPTVSVKATTEKIGPYNGTEFPVMTPIDGLYRVNRNVVGGITSIFYSFPDLRMNWVSSNFDGLYEISLRYFKKVGGTLEAPVVQEIPMTCFASSPPPDEAKWVALHKLILRVNNQPLNVHFDHIYLKHNTTGHYYAGEGNPDVPGLGGAYDFNDEGLCEIMNLQSTYDVEIHFTAHHVGQYMREYELWAAPNDDPNAKINFALDSFDSGSNTTATDPLWEGTPPGGDIELNKSSFPKNCAYIFHLRGNSRLQNGYNHIQWRHPLKAYYVNP
jgi:hypothetical protein